MYHTYLPLSYLEHQYQFFDQQGTPLSQYDPFQLLHAGESSDGQVTPQMEEKNIQDKKGDRSVC